MQVNILETNVLHFCVDTKKKRSGLRTRYGHLFFHYILKTDTLHDIACHRLKWSFWDDRYLLQINILELDILTF